MRSKGYDIKFFSNQSENFFSSEILFINSNVFRPLWKPSTKDMIFQYLDKARKASAKIFWFDTTDSTWCTQFEVLPYVDVFLKGQVFANLDDYLVKYRTGRIFTDYFSKLYSLEEKEYEYTLPEKNLLNKVRISWNTCFENYTEDRYGILSKIKNRIRKYTWNYAGESLVLNFHSASAKRGNQISCRIGLSHERPSVLAHRRAIIREMDKRGVDCGKISLPEYFSELKNSFIGIGPFGVGEITLRDFEIIICGAALLKPDMRHMTTWPELFVPKQTYIPHKWDLSDFYTVIDDLLKSSDLCRQVAENAQDRYKKILSPDGMRNFAERLSGIIENLK
jgi:hypothetical protein